MVKNVKYIQKFFYKPLRLEIVDDILNKYFFYFVEDFNGFKSLKIDREIYRFNVKNYNPQCF